MSDDSSGDSHHLVMQCDVCHRRRAIGYTEGFEYPDSVVVYCRACAEGVEGVILFDSLSADNACR